MAPLIGATVFQTTYPKMSGWNEAATLFNTNLGAPWATTACVVYYEEFKWPNGINDINPVGKMAAAGVFLIICVKPGRTMTVSEYNNLVNFIALLQANAVQFIMVLWQEPNTDGASGAFASAAAYTAYVNYYIPALNAAGVKHMYKPAMSTPGTVVPWYPGDANVYAIGIDYYFLDFLNKHATIGSILNVAANHSGGPCPVWLSEWGVVDGPKLPSIAKFNLWAVNQVQVPLITYINQGGSIGGMVWYDAGAGGNQIDQQTPGSQIITMLNVTGAVSGAQPTGQIIQGPDYPDFQTPQANADAISFTGAPLLSLSGAIISDLIISLQPGQSVPIPNLLISQLGYEIQISTTIGSGSTTPFVVTDLSWIDPTSGLAVAEEQWILPCADSDNINTFNGTGPTKAGELTVTLTNLDAAAEATVTIVMLANSRVYIRDRWIQTVDNPSADYPIVGGRPFSNVIASYSNQSVPAGESISVLLPLYAGDVSWYIDQLGVTAADIVAKLQVAPTSRFGTASFWSGSPSGGTGSGIYQLMRWPRAPVLLTVVNNGGVTSTINLKAIALDEAH